MEKLSFLIDSVGNLMCVTAAGERAAEPDVRRSGGAQGPDARREWPGHSED